MTEKARVLFVDDERRILTTMRMLFRGQYEMSFANSANEAIEFLKRESVDVVVSDQRMPGMTGVDLLREAKDLRPAAMRILLTGYSDLNAIIGSINEGEIFRFVNKPWDNQELKDTVAQAVEASKETREAMEMAKQEGDDPAALSNLPATLVLDEDLKVAPAIQEMLGDQYRIVAATTIEGAIEVMEREAVGVVITDIRVQNQSVVSLLSTLKEHNPELISMVVTARADAGMAIELINQGQIYRFITKPLKETQTRITVASAINHHRRMARHQNLAKRYQVQKPVEASPEAPPLATGLLGRIRSLRRLVTG
ncbi:MAG: response regulator [Oceanococcus sp.]